PLSRLRADLQLPERNVPGDVGLAGQSEHALADDRALDLIGATVDGWTGCGEHLHGDRSLQRSVEARKHALRTADLRCGIPPLARDVRSHELADRRLAAGLATGLDGRPTPQSVPPLPAPQGVEADDLLPDGGVPLAAEPPRQLDQRRESASEHRRAPGPDPGPPRLRGGDELPDGDLELRPKARSARRRNPRIDAGACTEA